MKKIQKKIKKYNVNFRRVLINILILFTMFSLFSIFTSFDMGKRQINTSELVIQGEDTIWNIANNICRKNKEENLNVQNVIIEIKEINNLTTSQIYEGQVLNIPIY